MTLRSRFRSVVVFGLGFFALTAQTLLLRSFLTVFEGNELAVGCFFGSWLLWVAMGALTCRAANRVAASFAARAARGFELLPLLYIPVFVLQHWLILSSRDLAGIAPFELFPLARLVPMTLLINAPMSFVTGWLFVLACQWKAVDEGLTVSRVYMLESLGSFAGGVVVTLLLAAGFPEETLLFVCAFVPAVAAVGASDSMVRRGIGAAVVAGLAAGLAMGLDGRWGEAQNRRTWGRLLPVESFQGAFATPSAKYLYGARQGQLVVMSRESIRDVVPATEYASEVIALHLAQKPDASRALVLGQAGLSICNRLLELPQIEAVTWLDPDVAYPGRLMAIVPPQLLADPQRLHVPEADARSYLKDHAGEFDLVIVNLPGATNLDLCRYATVEFFQLVRSSLRQGGVVGASVAGGENFMGGDLASLGASLYHTLGSVFAETAIKPGDETWLLGSASSSLSEDADALVGRFETVPGAAAVFPPEGLRSLYPADRIAFQRTLYETRLAERGEDRMLNTDSNPRALSHALLVAVHQSGAAGLGRFIKRFSMGGVWLPVVAVLLYTCLRLLFRRRRGVRPAPGDGMCELLDSRFVVFSTAAAGMSLSICLMFMLQMRFGALLLYVGLVSSLFMLGLYCGSRISETLLTATQKPRMLLLLYLLGHVALFQGLLLLPPDTSAAAFGLLFLVCGVFGGVYVPLLGDSMRREGLGAVAAGSSLETADHIGGAFGGLLTGIILLPVLGKDTTLLLLGGLVAANVPALVSGKLPLARREGGAQAVFRAIGYVLAGVALLLLFAGNLFRRIPLPEERSVADIRLHAQRALQERPRTETVSPDVDVDERLLAHARRVLGDVDFVAKRATALNGVSFPYFEFSGSKRAPEGYFLTTGELAANIRGYNGPIVLAVALDRERTIRAIRIVRSRETPSWHRRVAYWCPSLLGRDIRRLRLGRDVDAISGATISCRAIVRSLMQTGILFDRAVLRPADAQSAQETVGAPGEPGDETTAGVVDPSASASGEPGVIPESEERLALEFPTAVLLAFLVAALFVRGFPHRRVRQAYLLGLVGAIGFWLNIQYSTDQLLRVLNGEIRELTLSTPFLVLVGVPLVVLLLGNVYCGHLCPFGALQELVGDLRPRAWRTDPDNALLRYGRAVKYLLLFALATGLALSLGPGLCQGDPLVTAFTIPGGWRLAFLGAILTLAFVYRRFWCRNLCPVGAFLSVLNTVKLLRPLSPLIRPGRCDLGVEHAREIDCISCDRCRFADSARVASYGFRRRDLLYVVAVPAMAVACVWSTFRTVDGREQDAVSAVSRVPGEQEEDEAGRQGTGVDQPTSKEPDGAVDAGEDIEVVLPAPTSPEDIPPRGKPRDVDMTRLRHLIDMGRLSTQEAKYYEKLEPLEADE